MTESPVVTRRTFLASAAAVALAGPEFRRGPARAPQAPDAIRLGVASYSLRNFPRADAIRMITALKTPFVNIKSVHLAYDAGTDAITAARAEFTAAGLQIVGGGTITFDKDTDDGVEAYFRYAKAAGMPLIVAACEPTLLPRIERFAIRYDIKVALHNHGPEDKVFPSPLDALRHVKSMDPRMGLCVDVGHTVRIGTDVVSALATAGPRVLDMHMKDLRDLRDINSQCVVGEGAMPIPAIFAQLRAIGYGGYVNLEYEIEADNPLPGMRQSFAYMRGVLAESARRRG